MADEPQWVQGPDGRWWPVQPEPKKDANGCGIMLLICLLVPITLFVVVSIIGALSRH